MIFNERLESEEIHEGLTKTNYRVAIRAVVFKDNKLLMVHSRLGDYKFPGGGVEKDEVFEDALKREVEEETGYSVSKVGEKVGVIVERYPDTYKENSVFEMTSHYYYCEVHENPKNQCLDMYEEELGFTPILVDLEVAIRENEALLKNEEAELESWTDRETFVLNKLREVLA